MEAPIPFDPTLDIEAVDLGRMSYDAALSAQRAEQDALLVSRPSRRRMKVFLVEHDAVITISRQLTGQRTEHAVLDWKQIGIESLGVIETFA